MSWRSVVIADRPDIDMLVGIIFHICLKTREAGQTYCNCDPSDPDTDDTNQDKSKAEIKALVTIFDSRV